jgi:glycogen synthase
MFTELSNENGHRIYIVPNNAQNISKMYAASDMALFLNDPSGMDELTQCFAYGVVPVSRDGKGIDDYNPVQETGNAFAFTDENKWSCFAALVRAVETYKFPYDWRTIQRHCMETK